MNFQNGLARAKILLTSSVSGQRSSLASSPSLSPSIAESQVHDKMEQSWVMSSIFLVRLFSCYERRRAATRYLMRVVHTIRWYSYSALKAWTCDLWPDLTWTITSTVTHWATILRFLTAIWMLQLYHRKKRFKTKQTQKEFSHHYCRRRQQPLHKPPWQRGQWLEEPKSLKWCHFDKICGQSSDLFIAPERSYLWFFDQPENLWFPRLSSRPLYSISP